MGEIDEVERELQRQDRFRDRSGRNYVRLLDTPRVWGRPFDAEIMEQSWKRQAEFERAVEEIIQKALFRCDVSSLNCPDPDWAGIIIGAMDTALSQPVPRTGPTQFRFLFGQTPLVPVGEPTNYTLFKQALIRLVRDRGPSWPVQPDIWLGRFYRLWEGVVSGIEQEVLRGGAVWASNETDMTWNHSKIIVTDGSEALAGGHNLNMDLFRSYPPVHDASVVVHGPAAAGAHRYLDQLWACGSDLLATEQLDIASLSWQGRDPAVARPANPLTTLPGSRYVSDCQATILQLHEKGIAPPDPGPEPPVGLGGDGTAVEGAAMLPEFTAEPFPLRTRYPGYDAFGEYKLATGMLALGKYWRGRTDFQDGSELMKRTLILGAKRSIKMSQMDLISAWKSNWSDHVVCQWILQALMANKALIVQVVVSPLDAGAGAEGDQYSFGSGAVRTFDLMRYYMTHDVATDAELPDKAAREDALRRLFIAPLYYTDSMDPAETAEGDTYHWPLLPAAGYTATLKEPPLSAKPPHRGVIGSAVREAFKASGYIYKKVPSAPGNHAKLMVIDDEAYVVGSDNLYPGSLSEFDYLIEGKEVVSTLLTAYWKPLWGYSGKHARSLSQNPVPTQVVPLAAVQSRLAALNTASNAPSQHVFYIGADGHVHLLWYEGQWLHGDLTLLTDAQQAAPASGLAALNSYRQVFYTGIDGHVHRLWNDGQWRHLDLSLGTAAPPAAPAGGLATLHLPEQPVYYVGADGHVHVIWYDQYWHHGDLSSQAGAPMAAAGESGLATRSAPVQEVFYLGADGHVYRLWNDGRWQCEDVSQVTEAPAAATESGLTAPTALELQHVFYAGTDGHVHQLWTQDGAWHQGDPSQIAGAPTAAEGGPTVLRSPDEQVCYAGTDGHVYLLTPSNPWTYTDLTPDAAALAAVASGLATLGTPVRQVFYIGADGHVYQLARDETADLWRRTDLSEVAATV